MTAVRRTPSSRRNRRRVVIIAAVLLLLFFGSGAARFYTDVMWFREVGFQSVLWTSLRAQFLLGLIVGLGVAGLIWFNLALASRSRPAYAVSRLDNVSRIDPMERYRDQILPHARWVRIAVAAAVGFLSGISASSGWRVFLLWLNRVDFGRTDPQFGLDIGFYVFQLPWLNFVLSWLWFALMVTLIVTLASYYLLGAIRPEGGLGGVEAGALAHGSVLLGLLALVKAAQYWLGRYALNFSERGVVTGASYTDVHAHLPALSVLAIISVISAGLFLVNIRFRRVSLPLAAVAIWIVFSVVAGGVWPFIVQRFSVEPQEAEREEPYIRRNIEATREAFGLSDVNVRDFPAVEDLTSEEVRANQALLQNVRLWDPSILERAYLALQAIRTYYEFHDVDIDRYEIDGEMRQVLLSARELSLTNLQDPTWSNEHLQFTHGFGVVASLANEATASGQPSFLVKDVPGTVAPAARASFELEQPRLYYGEGFGPGEYSVVDTRQEEIDFPVGQEVERSRYGGTGGVSMGNPLTRLAFALRESDPNLVLSSLITSDSQVLIYRNVRDRVQRAAPFLALDNDPYPAVVDGRLVWIVDAYTTTPYFPYSQRLTLGNIVESTESGTLSGDANYIRNSVKVVVDAYDGTMDFYVVDRQDPLVRAWRRAFPLLFAEEEPSDDLRAHFRFPEDLFRVQSQTYLTYHVTDPQNFYAKEDAWEIPIQRNFLNGSLEVGGTTVSPTYLLIQLPGESEQEFVLTRPFSPKSKKNMIALMAARSDPEHYGELVTLRFPSQLAVLGPELVDNRINQDVEISEALTLLGQQGSSVSFGSLVILPIEKSILYVQPLFVTASDGGIPELKRVILVSGEEVVMGDGFEGALAELFDLGGPAPGPPIAGPGQGGPEAPAGELARIIAEAGLVYRQAQDALKAGDFERYGSLIEELGDLLSRAEALSS